MLKAPKILFSGLFIAIILIIANPVFGSLKLEQKYPDAVSVEAITHETTIAQAIKYYFTWAIIIALLVVLGRLIISGAQYAFFSAGKPALMAKATKGLQSSFWGLAILAVSYLVLLAINPQITILTIAKTPVESGIVLLTEEGLRNLEKPNSTTTLQTLIENNQAHYLTYQSNDLTEELGKLKLDQSGAKANFQRFTVFAIGFWGQSANNNVKLITYSETGLKGEKMEYISGGKIDGQGAIIRASAPYGSSPEIINVIAIDPADFVKSKVEIIDPNKSDATTYFVVSHPFLSFRTEGIGPGTYLLSGDEPGDEQRYLPKTGFYSDLGRTLDFDDKATQIKIINSGSTDYLAILNSDKDFKGMFRLFFQERNLSIIPNLYAVGKTNSGAAWTVIDLDKLKSDLAYFQSGAYEVNPIFYKLGNVPLFVLGKSEEGVGVNSQDLYGQVNNASSLRLFNLEKVESSSCREVKLCQGPDFTGYCLSFTPNGRAIEGNYQTLTLPLPWYAPVNIPKRMTGTVKTQQGEEKVGSDNNQFANNIRSIEITGNCLAVLFEYELTNLGLNDCLTDKDCLGGGARSEVFISSDDNLADNQVGVCTTEVLGIKIGDASPCASSIVVYPVK